MQFLGIYQFTHVKFSHLLGTNASLWSLGSCSVKHMLLLCSSPRFWNLGCSGSSKDTCSLWYVTLEPFFLLWSGGSHSFVGQTLLSDVGFLDGLRCRHNTAPVTRTASAPAGVPLRGVCRCGPVLSPPLVALCTWDSWLSLSFFSGECFVPLVGF